MCGWCSMDSYEYYDGINVVHHYRVSYNIMYTFTI